MKKVRLFILFALLSVTISSCSDIIEKSIAKQTVTLIAPGNSDTVSSYSQTFYWDVVDGALTYELQLASPDFKSPTAFIDTTVGTTKYTYTLPNAGQWQWQVSALNGSSQTNYTTNSFTVIAASFASQKIALESPLNGNYISSVNTPVFSWQSLPGANEYIVTIDTTNGKIIDTTQSNQLEVSALKSKQGSYVWEIKAVNDSNTNSEVVSANFNLLTLPDSVSNLYPPNKATKVSTSIALQWVDNSNGSNINNYKVYLYPSTGAAPSGFPLTVSTPTTGTITLNSGVTYTWHVIPIDKAGNVGTSYSTWTFSVQ